MAKTQMPMSRYSGVLSMAGLFGFALNGRYVTPVKRSLNSISKSARQNVRPLPVCLWCYPYRLSSGLIRSPEKLRCFNLFHAQLKHTLTYGATMLYCIESILSPTN